MGLNMFARFHINKKIDSPELFKRKQKETKNDNKGLFWAIVGFLFKNIWL